MGIITKYDVTVERKKEPLYNRKERNNPYTSEVAPTLVNEKNMLHMYRVEVMSTMVYLRINMCLLECMTVTP